MAFNFMLPLRILQALMGILILALGAYVTSWYDTKTPWASPSQINFLLFCGLWTAFLAVPYLALSPRFFPSAAHRFGILAAEFLTMLFWFAAFIAGAVFLVRLRFCRGSVCHSAKAAVVLGAFEWVFFGATTAMAVIHVFRSRSSGYTGTRHRKMEIHSNI